MSREIVIHCQRLPSMGDQPPRMRLSGEGIEPWEDAIPPQINAILAGRWSCRLRIKIDAGGAEVLGEAPDAPPPDEPDDHDAPPSSMKFPGPRSP